LYIIYYHTHEHVYILQLVKLSIRNIIEKEMKKKKEKGEDRDENIDNDKNKKSD